MKKISENLGEDLRIRSLVGFLLLLFIGLGLSAVLQNSLTYDEPNYLSVGVLYSDQHNFFLNENHPPLMKYLYAVPVMALEKDHSWISKKLLTVVPVFNLAKRVHVIGEVVTELYRRHPLGIKLIRLLPLGMAMLLLGLVFLWSRALYGDWAGLLSLTLGVGLPSLLAHSTLATLDLPVTFFFFLSVFAFSRFYEDRSLKWAVLCIAAVALAVGIKLTAVILFPVFVINLLILSRAKSSRTDWPAWRLVLVLGVTSYLALHLFYRSAVDWRYGLPLPVSLVNGLRSLSRHLTDGTGNFLIDKTVSNGRWYFYPLMLLMKSPLPAIGLFAYSVFSVARKSPAFRTQEIWLVVSPLVFLGACCAMPRMNYGSRYLLPMAPFLLVFMGRVAKSKILPSPFQKVSLTLLLLWLYAGTLAAGSNFISYENELSQMTGFGEKLSCDSDLDWGHSLIRLKKFMQANNIVGVDLPVNDYLIFGFGVDPAIYDLRYRAAPYPSAVGTLFAVSTCSKNWADFSHPQKQLEFVPYPGSQAVLGKSLQLGHWRPAITQ